MRAPRHNLGQRDRGFTLLEVMVVVLVIGILLAVGIPTYLGARDRANDRAAQTSLRDGLGAATVVFTDNQTFADANATNLAAAEPGITFVASPTASADDSILSVATSTDGTVWAAAARSTSGECFYIRLDSEGSTSYGSSATSACTGETGLTVTGTGFGANDGDADGDNIADNTDRVVSSSSLVSRGQPATQSSTYNSTTPASDAVDGSYVGVNEGDNAITHNTPHRWWEVDLGASYTIDSINVWNRNHSGQSVNERLDGAVVMVSTTPLGDVDLSAAQPNAAWSVTIVDAGVVDQFAVPNVVGRYVRVQLPSTGSWLQLAEVDVFGTPTGG